MSDPPEPPDLLNLTREVILSGSVQHAAARTPGMAALLSEEDFRRSIAETLASGSGEGDVWVFGYGSLMWNPAFVHDAQRVGRVRGWHRSFCLWTSLSRGSPERPGLILGLDRGGACTGIVFRIPAAHTEQELAVLWRREMSDGAYTPRWVTAQTDQGAVRALTFTMKRSHIRYAGKLDQLETVRVIANAVGKMGRCSDYLEKTVAALQALGIRDRPLTKLCAQVRTMVAESGRDATVPPSSVL